MPAIGSTKLKVTKRGTIVSTAIINKRANAISKDLTYDFPAIQLARTGRFIRLMGRVTFVTLVLALVAMFFVPWRQTAPGTGVVLALNPQERPQPVKSPAKGVISEVKAGLREGSRVTKGQILLRLKPLADQQVELLNQQISAALSKAASAELNVENTRNAIELQKLAGESMQRSLLDGLDAAEKKYEQSKNEIDAYRTKLTDKENQKRIAEEVVKEGIISQQDFFTKTQAAAEAKFNLEKAENKAKETKAALEEKRQQVAAYEKDIELKNRSAEQKHNDAIQKLAVANKELLILKTKRSELDRLDIPAPCSGVIQQWYGVEGADTVKEGDQLFVIVPETDNLGVEMKVTGNDMPLIKEGDKVRLQFEGWPAVQFVGWPSVAVGTFGGKVSRVFPTDDGKGNFRVLISPDNNADIDDGWPDDRYLRQGVRANGWVLLNEVPLGYEIWRQLNGFPPTVADEEPTKDKKKGGKVKLPKP